MPSSSALDLLAKTYEYQSVDTPRKRD